MMTMIKSAKNAVQSVLSPQNKTKHPDFDVEEVLSQLTIEEKTDLLSGTDFWHLAAIPRLNIPAIRVSDGPNGVRGTKFFDGVPAACLPCGESVSAEVFTLHADTEQEPVSAQPGTLNC